MLFGCFLPKCTLGGRIHQEEAEPSRRGRKAGRERIMGAITEVGSELASYPATSVPCRRVPPPPICPPHIPCNRRLSQVSSYHSPSKVLCKGPRAHLRRATCVFVCLFFHLFILLIFFLLHHPKQAKAHIIVPYLR